MSQHRAALLERFAADFIGLGREDPVYNGTGQTTERRRVYLDTTATSLMPRAVWQGLTEYFEAACANSHTEAHRAGRDTTEAIERSRDAVGRLVGYNPDTDVVLFTANGATGATNFLSRALFPPELRPILKRFDRGAPPELVLTMKGALGLEGSEIIDEMLRRPLIVTTAMEHHSNLLPWMEAVGHHNVRAVAVDARTGALDLDELRRVLDREGDKVRLVTLTGVSNVTGIINPVHDVAKLAHAAGAQVMVDGAQWVPHGPVRMHTEDPAERIDFLVLSGHKMYAPGSRGALVGTLSTLSARRCVSDVGGGMVDYVSIEDFEIKDEVTAREEAGTPNIPGSISMGLVSELLMRIGMDTIAEAEHHMTRKLVERLDRIEGVAVYGSTDIEAVPRAGVVSFNVLDMHHALVAAYLNDFHNIAVRNACFCANPYVTAMLEIDHNTERKFRTEIDAGDRRHLPGMVRASLGVYSTEADIEALGQALEQLIAERTTIELKYHIDINGDFHIEGAQPLPQCYSVTGAIDRWMSDGT